MNEDITLRMIKGTIFRSLYNRFIIGFDLSKKEYENLLALAICFVRSKNGDVQKLGYRIIVEYCNQKHDYIPLYEIAINTGLYPVSRFIEHHYIDDEKRNFYTEWNDAFTEQYVSGGICLSEEQYELVSFFESNKDKTLSISAPTSYGKSELILSAVKEYAGRKICIITSTKALLMQTKKRVQGVAKGIFPKIVIHPEMYNSADTSCLAILTQERCLRIFKMDASLCFDCIIIDEAHEMLESSDRSHALAEIVMLSQNRNPNTVFKFLTPFIDNEDNLKVRYTSYDIESFKVSEYIKTEKYYLYDLRKSKELKLYDQFFDEFIDVQKDTSITTEAEFIKAYSKSKNIVYLNKPTHIEEFALALADDLPDSQSEMIETACANISGYLQPQYNLIKCLRKGIIYHHGSVPDAIRSYIEELYKKDKSVKYIITSSTLLSGVNLPAERMFILSNKRGNSNLSSESFRNLVGRVCRFSEIFDAKNGDLCRLEPQIYLVFGKYFSSNANCEKYLSEVAKINRINKEKIDNVLLNGTNITHDNEKELHQREEYIENYQANTIDNYQGRYIKTEYGKACIMNGVNEFDVFEYEQSIQMKIDAYKANGILITDSQKLLEAINNLFIDCLRDNNDLKRLKKEPALKFYTKMIEWRTNNKSYSEMIGLLVGYWRELFKKDNRARIYVGRWGDEKWYGSKVPRYTKIIGKNKSQLINLAIVRIKDEQDFIDNKLMKFVEVLHDLNLIDLNYYTQIKYGTDNENVICLVKNGLSLSSAILLVNKYYQHLQIDIASSTVKYDADLLEELEKENENRILIYEIRNCM